MILSWHGFMKPLDLEQFETKGWIVVDIPETSFILTFIKKLELKSKEYFKQDVSLKSINNLINTKEELLNFQEYLTNFLWDEEFSTNFLISIKPIITYLVGLNIMAQYKPFLRIARPKIKDDNIGFHKDTQYGQTPYEIAIHVPFVDLDKYSALQVISGSHLHDENKYKSVNNNLYKVKKGSLEHSLGKPYDPKTLSIPENVKVDFLEAKVGQVAIFSPSIFHGQEINNGKYTRVSTDLRIVDSNKAGLNLKIGKVHTGYVKLFLSPVEKMAKKYFESQTSSKKS